MKNLKVFGTSEHPRICVFRSNRYFYAQAIDDQKRRTLVSFSSKSLKKEITKSKLTKTEEAKKIGIEFAKKLLKKGIKKGMLDRRNYLYLGRVRSFTEGLRGEGIKI